MKEHTVKLRGLNLEIWRHNFEPNGEIMTVGNAIRNLENLGDGWRLPDYTEMRIISYLMDLGVLDDKYTNNNYWTSFEDPDLEGYYIVFSFRDKSFYSSVYNDNLNVRPVRTI